MQFYFERTSKKKLSPMGNILLHIALCLEISHLNFSKSESMSHLFCAQWSISIWVWRMYQEYMEKEMDADSLPQGIPYDSFVFISSNRGHKIKSAICSQAVAWPSL